MEWLADNKELLSWIFGAIATAAGGMWAVVKFYLERRDRQNSRKAAGTSSSTTPSGNVHIGDSVTIQQASLSKPALALAVIGLALLAYAAFFSRNDCIQGSVVTGDVSGSQINVDATVTGDCE
ncbi:MAG: hypothetical protein AAF563_06905 [Pseudomonadota bacterium]